MNIKLIVAMLLMGITTARASELVPDLTGAGAPVFKSHLGQTVSLCGQLPEDTQGFCLTGATPEGTAFYVIAALPEQGSFVEPAQWARARGHRVRVTGRLRFRAFPPTHDPTQQTPPGYYYMVLQHTELRRLDSK